MEKNIWVERKWEDNSGIKSVPLWTPQVPLVISFLKSLIRLGLYFSGRLHRSVHFYASVFSFSSAQQSTHREEGILLCITRFSQNWAPLPNCKGCRKEMLWNIVEWALQLLKTCGSLDADSPSGAVRAVDMPLISHRCKSMKRHILFYFRPCTNEFLLQFLPSQAAVSFLRAQKPTTPCRSCYHFTTAGQALQNQVLMALWRNVHFIYLVTRFSGFFSLSSL